jgi:hypothetical protein
MIAVVGEGSDLYGLMLVVMWEGEVMESFIYPTCMPSVKVDSLEVRFIRKWVDSQPVWMWCPRQEQSR